MWYSHITFCGGLEEWSCKSVVTYQFFLNLSPDFIWHGRRVYEKKDLGTQGNSTPSALLQVGVPVLCAWCQQRSKLHSYRFILLLSANSWHKMGEYLLQSLIKWAVGSIFTCPQAQPYKGQMVSLPAVGQTAGSVDHISPVGVLQAKRMKWTNCAQY